MELEQNGWKAIFGRWISERIGHHLCNFPGAGNGCLRPCQAQWLEEGTHGQKKREEWSFLVTDWSGKRSSQRTSRSWLLPLLFHLLHHHLHRYHHHHHHYHHHLHHHQPYHNHHHCHAYLTNWHIDTLLYTSMLPRSPISLGELPPFKSHWGLPYPHYIKLQNPSPLHSQMLFFSTFTEA